MGRALLLLAEVKGLETMGVSTKKGDSGSTGLLGGERVPKFHLRIEAGGALDETNSLLGSRGGRSGERYLPLSCLTLFPASGQF
jgi:hypothetical protein